MSFMTPLFAMRFTDNRGRASAFVSVILSWSRFTAPLWAPCYEFEFAVLNTSIVY